MISISRIFWVTLHVVGLLCSIFGVALALRAGFAHLLSPLEMFLFAIICTFMGVWFGLELTKPFDIDS
jgi:hypothetical protein